ncbi:hypothetical protein [Roseobacter sp.]|uniref:hypothetical protein n=1 Tax=Roseobacter sp. TaxID=1907202 RepID=UPI0025DBBE1C|nr:hypothetical protein [Roseobacter sp.]
MTRRTLTVILHWSVLCLLMLLLAAGSSHAVLSWAFGLAGLAMTGLALVFGLMNGPGPKLTGGLRAAHPWVHRALYALLGWSALAVLTAAAGNALPGPSPRNLLVALLGAGLLHGIFNLWRSTTLNDGALRRMLPVRKG